MASHSESDNLLGERLKHQRRSKGLSLRALGDLTGLTASFLSQVERGLANPSIGTLRRIADALEVSILTYFVDSPEADPLIRADSRPKISFPERGLYYELLTPDSARRIEVFIGHIEPGVDNFVHPLREPTEEFILVLQGALAVELETGHYELGVGDSMCFEGALLREVSNAAEEETVWISMLTPPVF